MKSETKKAKVKLYFECPYCGLKHEDGINKIIEISEIQTAEVREFTLQTHFIYSCQTCGKSMLIHNTIIELI